MGQPPSIEGYSPKTLPAPPAQTKRVGQRPYIEKHSPKTLPAPPTHVSRIWETRHNSAPAARQPRLRCFAIDPAVASAKKGRPHPGPPRPSFALPTLAGDKPDASADTASPQRGAEPCSATCPNLRLIRSWGRDSVILALPFRLQFDTCSILDSRGLSRNFRILL